jgi:hypothetical protein
MSIKIEYLLQNQKDFKKFEISFEDYFDLEENEKIEIDSIPKFSQPYQYLNVKLEDIVALKLEFEINNEKRTFNQVFWNKGFNILTERIDLGSENYKEIILSIKSHDKNNNYETIRLYVGEKYTVPIYHSIIQLEKSGQETESNIETNFFIEMIKNGLLN